MPNPPVLVCDADALYQILLTNQVALLRYLRDHYGIQPVVVDEVDLDIKGNKKLFSAVGPDFKKALGNGTLTLLDGNYFRNLTGLPRNTTFQEIQLRGKRYNYFVGRGEAYTHAAGLCMGVPAMSNDWEAIKVLKGKGFDLPTPILRAFDLVCFGFQTGIITAPQCENFRKDLLKRGEHIPKAFSNASFTDGLNGFTPRLLCSSENPVGRVATSSTTSFDQALLVTPRVGGSAGA